MLFTLCEEKHSFFKKYQISSVLYAIFNISRILISVFFFFLLLKINGKPEEKAAFIGKERVEGGQ